MWTNAGMRCVFGSVDRWRIYGIVRRDWVDRNEAGEGGCGACTVVLSHYDWQAGTIA